MQWLRLAPIATLVCFACNGRDSSPQGQAEARPAEAASSTTPARTAGTREQDGRCRTEQDRDAERTIVTVSATTPRGSVVSLTHTVVSVGPTQREIHQRFELDRRPLMTVSATLDGEHADGQLEYGEAFGGLRRVTTRIDRGTLTASFDGRSIVPMPADAGVGAIQFADGGPPPELTVDDGIAEAIRSALDRSQEVAAGCGGASRVIGFSPGHSSNPDSSGACLGCKAGCVAAGVGCAVGVGLGCAAALWAYLACAIPGWVACTAVQVGCWFGCEATGAPCCPVGCGSACCESGESCLNNTQGVCCSAGATPCAGESCCDSSEVCIPGGPNAGACCEAERLCGNECCGELEACAEDKGFCCPFESNACGDTCCPAGATCIDDEFCCPAGRDACGSTCCAANQTCANPATGECVALCPAGNQVCEDDSCCPANKVCSGVPGVCCDFGELYCDGACRPLNECIF